MSTTTALARRLPTLVLSPREIDAYDTLFEQAWRFGHFEQEPGEVAKYDLADFTFAELLVAFAGMLSGAQEDEYEEVSDGADFVDFSAVTSAGQLLRVLAISESDHDYLAAVSALAERDPAVATAICDDALAASEKGTPEIFMDDVCMGLPSDAYCVLTVSPEVTWTDFIAQKLLENADLTPAQRELSATLSQDWHGTGATLLDTIRRLHP